MRTSFGKINALSEMHELSVPIVILQRKKLDQKQYIGFVPALTKKDIVCNSLDECKTILKQAAKDLIVNMYLTNTPFPFFPTKEEILEDFENVCYVSFIKVKQPKK